MVTLEEIFAYPLTLPLISVGVSAGLSAWLTHFLANRRRKREIEVENRRKELEIKVDITSKMTEVIAYTMANSLLSTQRKITDSNSEKIKAEDDESLRKFYVDVNVINSKLESYFSEPKINEKWVRYYETLLAFRYFSKDYSFEHTTDEQKNGIKFRAEAIRKYFSDRKGIDWDRFTTQTAFDRELWGDVANLFSHRGNEIIKEVFNLLIKVF
jgi:hypothetical protein